MLVNNSDRAWEKWAKRDPYFAVLTEPQYKKENLDIDGFFGSGESHISQVFDKFPDARPQRSLDFGCGVGRLLVPLASRSAHVIGVDVSPTMLDKARRNLEVRGISNFSLVCSDDSLSGVPDGLDFIHSFIVFQHIPVKRGEKLLSLLLSKLSSGGVAAIHFPFWDYSSLLRKLSRVVRRNIDFINYLVNISRGRAIGEPLMQYNHYSLSRVLCILHENQCDSVTCHLLSTHPQNIEIMLYFKKA